MKNTTMPTWFDGYEYKFGDTVTNPHTQESISLNNIELSLYDFILGFSALITGVNGATSTIFYQKGNKQFLRCRDWFIKNNFKAYQVLID